MARRRKTLVDVLFAICLEKYNQDGWKIRKSLMARTGVGKTLATTDEEAKEIIMYPRVLGENDPPLEMTLLHELLHIGLDLDGRFDGKGVTYWLEQYMWRRLTAEQKGVLAALLEEPRG